MKAFLFILLVIVYSIYKSQFDIIILPFTLIFGWTLVRYYLESKKKLLKCEGAIVITGTSSGFGEDAVKHFDSLGFHVYATVRNVDHFKKWENFLNVTPIMLDSSKSDTIQSAYKKISEDIESKSLELVGLINNAAVVLAGPMEAFSQDDIRYLMEVNVYGPIEIVNTFLPLLRKCKSRRSKVIYVGSVSGMTSGPGAGVYSMTKYSLEALVDAQRFELSTTSNIDVVLIQPGQFKTNIWNNAESGTDAMVKRIDPQIYDRYKHYYEIILKTAKQVSEKGNDPHKVTLVLEKAIRSQRANSRYRVGNDAHIVYFLKFVVGVPDSTIDWMYERVLAKAKKDQLH